MRDAVFIALTGLLLLIALARPFVGILVWSWISFMNAHRLAWGMAQTIPWAALAFFATVVGCIMAREPRSFRPNALMVLMVVFAVGITLTTFVAIGPADAAWAKWDRTIKIIAGLLLTAALLTERWRIHALVWLMVIGIGYFGVRGGVFTIVTGGAHRVLGPQDTMIADRNHIAVALLIVIPLMNWLRMHSAHHLVRVGLAVAMVLTLFATIGTQSRGALVTMVVVAGVFWLRTKGKLLSGIAIVLAVGSVIAFMPQSWVERMETIETFEQDGSAMGRVRIWEAALKVALARPLTGGGFRAVYDQGVVDTYAPGVVARATHSIYFEVLGEHGFILFGVWLAMIGLGVLYTRRIIAASRGRPDLAWAGDLARMSQVSILAYLVGGAFLSLAYWDVFWTLMIVLGATHALVRQSAAAPALAQSGAAAPEPLWRREKAARAA
ncbi:putative O-glycosylation ligase, exosortase A system-associated [Roseomonas alkaliterrae]|uniref:Putative O-glycosylation ligase (Exosortase A-associated) n=1 Tax=Neoroseomonas alkaliterrae TaxID=1452450 RepID=A0A840XRB9_9PROT|nr:putative O-glycosylation ligase (exosortase A-associated) [Neoroseomonas alkaliterrae]MBR0677487.1 putative O-glycosylation ligase, exosortase A system-associated [Neoroseomonas alkaliterrae]